MGYSPWEHRPVQLGCPGDYVTSALREMLSPHKRVRQCPNGTLPSFLPRLYAPLLCPAPYTGERERLAQEQQVMRKLDKIREAQMEHLDALAEEAVACEHKARAITHSLDAVCDRLGGVLLL